MPSACEECRFSTIGCQDNDICYLNNKEIYLDKKPDWCPLKPMPEKKQHTLYSVGAWNSGYNACIDEILGDKE